MIAHQRSSLAGLHSSYHPFILMSHMFPPYGVMLYLYDVLFDLYYWCCIVDHVQWMLK
jgi:hypothetical protein